MNIQVEIPVSVIERLEVLDATPVKSTRCPQVGEHIMSIASMFTWLKEQLAKGNTDYVIRYINRASIRSDVEAVLGYTITKEQALQCGRLAPCHIPDIELARAASIARELQALRHSGRRACQYFSLHGNNSEAFHVQLLALVEKAMDVVSTTYNYEVLERGCE
jgi:hypothetical protein